MADIKIDAEAIAIGLEELDLGLHSRAAVKGQMNKGAEIIRQLLKEREWMPIETAPKDGKEFLACYTRSGNVMILVRWHRVHKYWDSKGEPVLGFETNATHWLPLPPSPDTKQGE